MRRGRWRRRPCSSPCRQNIRTAATGNPCVRVYSIDAILDRLIRSDKTISTYKTRLQEKLGLSSLAALIEFAALHKLID